MLDPVLNARVEQLNQQILDLQQKFAVLEAKLTAHLSRSRGRSSTYDRYADEMAAGIRYGR